MSAASARALLEDRIAVFRAHEAKLMQRACITGMNPLRKQDEPIRAASNAGDIARERMLLEAVLEEFDRP